VLLAELHLDGFSEQQSDLYENIRLLMDALGTP